MNHDCGADRIRPIHSRDLRSSVGIDWSLCDDCPRQTAMRRVSNTIARSWRYFGKQPVSRPKIGDDDCQVDRTRYSLAIGQASRPGGDGRTGVEQPTQGLMVHRRRLVGMECTDFRSDRLCHHIVATLL